jgi:hypothetical protein
LESSLTNAWTDVSVSTVITLDVITPKVGISAPPRRASTKISGRTTRYVDPDQQAARFGRLCQGSYNPPDIDEL